jgi:hypothetical protein
MMMALSLVAVFAVMVSSAAAEGTGPKVTLRTAKGALVKGSKISAFSSNLVFSTSAGNLECTENTLNGFMKTNTKEKPSGEITEEKSTGTGGGLCETTTPFGKAAIESQNLSWKIKLTNAGVVQINSSHGDKTVTFESTFPSAGAHCAFASKKVLAKFPVSKTPVPWVITTTNQVFKLKAGSTPGCPTEGKLNGTFSTTSSGEPVEVEVK